MQFPTTIYLFSLIFMQINFAAEAKNDIYAKMFKVKCECLDKEYCEIGECILKNISNGRNEFYLDVILKKRPVTKFLLNIDFYRSVKGKYTPTYINSTLDACRFQRNRAINRVFASIYKWLERSCNFNHTCPFPESSFKLHNFTLFHNPYFSFLPGGNYKVKTNFIFNDKHYFSLENYVDYRNTKKTFQV